jgi:hypothetical protein
VKKIRKILPFLLLCILCRQAEAQIITLDDFSGPRPNPGNAPANIIQTYLGEDPGQTYTIGSGKLQVTGSPSAGIYWNFLSYPYTGTLGFAKGWIEAGTWDPNVNRLKFSFSCDRAIPKTASGYGNVQIGTYVKTDDGQPANQGAHYYHHIDPNIYVGKVVYVDINRTPTHQVGQDPSINWPENPTAPGFNYFDGLTRWYFDTQDGNWSGIVCEFGPITFTKILGEPDQQVYSVTYQYTGSRYEVTWGGPKNSSLQFDIAYSTQSMNGAGFSSGTAAGTVSATGNDYTNVIWASPNMQEAAAGLYVAIRPQGQTSFTEVFIPNSSGAPSPPSPPTPTVSMSASPLSITLDQSSNLSWSSADVTSCTASDGWSGTRATSGNLSVSPATTTTYTLTCTGTNGSANQSATVTVSAAPPSAPPPSFGSSAAAYSLDEGSGSVAADFSGNGNTLSLSGASWSSGRTGNALLFNGTDFADAANSSSLNITSNQVTLEAWVNPTALSGDTHIVSKIIQAGQHNSPYFAYSLHIVSGNVPRFWVTTGGAGNTVQSSVGLTTNAWYHIAGTYDGATMKIYVNGQLAGSASVTGNINGYNGPLRLGANGSGSEVWSGKIDDLRVYSQALSQAGIQADMNTPVGGGAINQPPAAPSALALQ